MNRIEQRIRSDDWDGARDLIKKALKNKPNDHWLLTRLSLTYYEQRDYRTSLKYSRKALTIAPYCPLVLWDLAGTLEMLRNTSKAIEIYRSLTRRGASRIAKGPCGEGTGWSKGLIADCYYRLARCYDRKGMKKASLKALKKHLNLRGPGCYSIYRLAEVRKKEA